MKKITVAILTVLIIVVMVFVGKKYQTKNVIVIQQPSEISNTNLGEYTLTWYCEGEITASGNKVNHELTVAGDLSNGLKFNDVVYVKELGKAYVVHDTGRLVKGKRLDIYVNDCRQAVANGIKKSEVYLIGE